MKDSASATALLVASGVAFQSTHPKYGHLVPKEAGELSRRFIAATGRRVRSGSSRIDRAIIGMWERIGVPGLTLHYVMRKRAIEEIVRAAIADGYRQLVVLGAGLDTLGFRLRNDLTVIEIDHPATQAVKREVMGVASLELVAADFTRDNLTSALERCASYDPAQPAIFLAEAVLMYLDEAVVRDVFRQLRARPARTRVIFTFFEPRPGRALNFQNATPVADFWLQRVGEPARWAIAPESVGEFFRTESFELLRVWRDREYQSKDRSDDVPLARGEHIAVAEHRA